MGCLGISSRTDRPGSPNARHRFFWKNHSALGHPALLASAEKGNEPFFLNISGVVAEQPMAGLAAYSASKAAIYAFNQAAAKELRRVGIRVIDARPGHTETDLASRAIFGTSPAFPTGMDASAVAARIVEAIQSDERDLPASAF